MSSPRLPRALGASAGVHLAALAGLLALAHPVVRPAPLPMRVSLVPEAAGGPSPGSEGEQSAPARASAGGPSPARPPPGRSLETVARRRVRQAAPREAAAVQGEPADATAGLTPVQEDLWMLGATVAGAAGQGGSPAAGGPTSEEQGSGAGPASGAPGGNGAGGSSATSLLEALQRRLAWSAARCAPASAVRVSRRGVPGVPLHFCLDASGRPSGVGLLGTTGSDQLDRAARDCVLPGALPLPPAPGCYTVVVRFPVQG